ncbi:MAG: hypothetical protein ACYTG7_11305 [Planctomycetota bacterium]|jgi:nitrate reductase NapAB chaperone NapD
MALVGAFARIDPRMMGQVVDELAALGGVETFDLDDPGKVGILIASSDLDAAHETLTRKVRAVEGVWGAWPVFVHHEGGPQDAEQAVDEIKDDFGKE